MIRSIWMGDVFGGTVALEDGFQLHKAFSEYMCRCSMRREEPEPRDFFEFLIDEKGALRVPDEKYHSDDDAHWWFGQAPSWMKKEPSNV